MEALFQAYETGDEELLDRLLADDITIHMPGRGPLGGTWRGKAEVLGWLERMGAAAGESFKAEVHAVMADQDHVVALIEESAERDAKKYQWKEVDVAHIKDGTITELWILIDDLYAADEFFR